MKNNNSNNIKSWMAAAAFAEAGEWDTAKEMIPESRPNTEISLVARVFAAVAFAEEGLHHYAQQFVEQGRCTPKKSFEDDLAALGIGRIHLRYGVVCCE
ncbi:MAG: hypothetical protein M8357_05425 [Desulfobulbaceae bacterium]|nr:hypothetical protein [Desulfobulbaceae bacterium]